VLDVVPRDFLAYKLAMGERGNIASDAEQRMEIIERIDAADKRCRMWARIG